MSLSCPKCRFINPWGAEICGECGFSLVSEIEKDKKEEKYPQLISGKKKGVSVAFRILGYIFLLNSILLVGLGVAPFFLSFEGQSVYGVVLIFSCLGGLGFIVSNGFLQARYWIVAVYSMWVAIKIFLYVLFWAGLWQPIPPSLLTSSRIAVLLGMLLVEIALVPYVYVKGNELQKNREKYKYL